MPSTDQAAQSSAPATGAAPSGPAADATDAPDPAAVAASLDEASYAHLLVRTDGTSVAAAGLLADRLPVFRCSPVAFDAASTPTDGADLLVAVGCRHPDDGPRVSGPGHALAVRRHLDEGAADEADRPMLARAGAVCAGADDGSGSTGSGRTTDEFGASTDDSAADGPPVATPTDVVEGLAHGTLVHAPFAGDRPTAERIVDETDPEAVASRAALAAIRDAPDRAAGAVERLLAPQPSPDGPLATVEGFADVLDVTARTTPGAALSLALGGTADAALESWREASERVHGALRAASVTIDGGVDRVRLDDPGAAPPVELLARLHHEFRAVHPATVVAGADRIGLAAATLDHARAGIESAIESHLSVGVDGTTARARAPTGDATAAVDPIAETLAEVTP